MQFIKPKFSITDTLPEGYTVVKDFDIPGNWTKFILLDFSLFGIFHRKWALAIK